MYKIYTYLFSIFIFVYQCACQGQPCPTEHLEFYNKAIITWIAFNNSIVISKPPCLDKNNILIQRKCHNSQWDPVDTPQCHKIQEQFYPTCANNDTQFHQYCIYISKPEPMSDVKPVMKVESLKTTLQIALKEFNIREMWLPIKRNNAFGKFIWINGELAYKIYENKLLTQSYMPEDAMHNCIIATNVTINNASKSDVNTVSYVPKITDCHLKYPTVYVYKLKNRYLKKNDKIENFNFYYSMNGNKAYYLINTTQYSCKNIAEPRNAENNYIMKQLVGNNSCQIGIHKIKEVFRWNSSNETIEFADWAYPNNFSLPIVTISKNGWKLENNTSVTCAVCEIDQNAYITDLILKTNKKHSELVLSVYSYHQFFTIVCQVIGIDDVNLHFKVIPVKVKNNYNKIYNQIEKTDNRTVWILKFNNSNYNYYKCSGALYPHGLHKTTKTVLYGQINTGREYAFKVSIGGYCNNNICDPHLRKEFTNINVFFKERIKSDVVNFFRAIKIESINYKSGDIIMLFHVRTSNKIEFILSEYKKIQSFIEHIIHGSVFQNQYPVTVIKGSFKSCHGCMSEITRLRNNKPLFWNYTEIGFKAKPKTSNEEPCLKSNKLPVTRLCAGDFLYGAYWQDFNETCEENVSYTNITKKLNNLFNTSDKLSVTNIVRNLANFTTNSTNLEPIDIILVSQIFQNLLVESESNVTNMQNNSEIAKNVAMTMNNLISSNYSSLELSSKVANTTNIILETIEELLEHITENNLNDNGTFQEIAPNYMYGLIDPFVTNITGIALIRPNVTYEPPLTEYTIQLLYANTSIDKLIGNEQLEMATFVPELLLDDIKNKSGNETIRITFMIFYNDSLFVENTDENKTAVLSKVFSISILGYDNYLYSSIPILIKPQNKMPDTDKSCCGYWDFGASVNYPYKWAVDNATQPEYVQEKNIQICRFQHLTHFALLLETSFQKDYNYDMILSDINMESSTNEKDRDKVLDYLTAIGSILSAIGICGILLTAAIFKSWRDKPGTKVLLNVSLCILLQIILLYVNFPEDTITCKITGSLLHYSILCGFAWSLIMAFLQYLRFVRVIGPTTSHLILKTSIFGWISPIIPVFMVAIFGSSDYIPNMEQVGDKICYPKGNVLYATLIGPVVIIIIANLIIFCAILHSVFWKTSISQIRHNINEKEMFIQQFKLTILLFFSLSLSWIFGLLAASGYCAFCLYLFCTSAPFQGFILFVFYVLMDQSTRFLWIRLIKRKTRTSQGASSSGGPQRPTIETNTNTSSSKEVVFNNNNKKNTKIQNNIENSIGTSKTESRKQEHSEQSHNNTGNRGIMKNDNVNINKISNILVEEQMITGNKNLNISDKEDVRRRRYGTQTEKHSEAETWNPSLMQELKLLQKQKNYRFVANDNGHVENGTQVPTDLSRMSNVAL